MFQSPFILSLFIILSFVVALAFPLSRFQPVLSPAQAAGKKENQKDKQDESKTTAPDQRPAEVKSATAE
jgi:hypothetical protein